MIVHLITIIHQDMTSVCLPAAAIMSSVLKKLISPLASGPAEPPRNKVTVVGVGQVGMACAISILLRVRHNNTVCYKRELEKSPYKFTSFTNSNICHIYFENVPVSTMSYRSTNVFWTVKADI